MAVGFRRKGQSKRANSKLSSSMVSPSSTRSKPITFSRLRGFTGSSGSLRSVLVVLFVIFFVFVTWKLASSQGPIPHFYSFDVVNEFPHDPEAFTQGLLYDGNGTLLESTGFYGKSTVRKVDLQSGKVELSYAMGKSFFGEGLTLFGERLLQVTWLTKTGFIYDRYNLSKIGRFAHPMNDGWGLATDGKVIFGSDGSSTLYLLDPVTWKAMKKTTVKYNDHEISLLNELEYVNGEVLANVWQTDCIARISPDSGSVLSWILLHELRQNLLKLGHTGIDVLNGIAWDEKNKRLFVTGKLWPKLYEIRLRPVTPPFNGNIKKICPIRGSGEEDST
ncbi:glutaminyl-peptide cyclotransferase isoform X1 [Dendrobium catenatum]|uniref:Glutaminyl-peptide cyclotransferase n=1 Tax=Dendrobium catenatum TaxID=906689 RepID=A0A2I0WIR7_9ASPA|nr:glutaminyl-peptide cyclotransferase isoform X1 [Dendrobium catenatum]PKU75549.1 Glutaminyl-peptide cyclotransferase [Dendrobium catenatum]